MVSYCAVPPISPSATAVVRHWRPERQLPTATGPICWNRAWTVALTCPSPFVPTPRPHRIGGFGLKPRWDVHFGGLENDQEDSTAPHITFRPHTGGHRQRGLAICTFHRGFSLVPVPDSLVDTGKSLPTVDSTLLGNDGQVKRVSSIRHIQVETVLNQYQGGMCISGSLTMTERTPRHLISPLGPSWVGTIVRSSDMYISPWL